MRLDTGAELTVADPLPGVDIALAIRPRPSPSTATNLTEAPHTWTATVTDLEADHDRVRVTLTGPVAATAEVTPAAVAELDLAPGMSIWATVKAVDLTAYLR